MSINIAIDGPAGAGKSSIAKRVAEELSFVYVDTGAMYRTMALYFLKNQIDMTSEETISVHCEGIQIELKYKNGEQQILLNGENVSAEIRNEEVGNAASLVAKHTVVRTKLVALQRELAKTTDLIMDGRDIGTVVLPDADKKIYLTASSLVRAKRRYLELQKKGLECNLTKIEKDIIDRDKQDMNRSVSPLKQAEDAIFLDSSDMTIQEVVDKIINIIRS